MNDDNVNPYDHKFPLPIYSFLKALSLGHYQEAFIQLSHLPICYHSSFEVYGLFARQVLYGDCVAAHFWGFHVFEQLNKEAYSHSFIEKAKEKLALFINFLLFMKQGGRSLSPFLNDPRLEELMIYRERLLWFFDHQARWCRTVGLETQQCEQSLPLSLTKDNLCTKTFSSPTVFWLSLKELPWDDILTDTVYFVASHWTMLCRHITHLKARQLFEEKKCYVILLNHYCIRQLHAQSHESHNSEMTYYGFEEAPFNLESFQKLWSFIVNYEIRHGSNEILQADELYLMGLEAHLYDIGLRFQGEDLLVAYQKMWLDLRKSPYQMVHRQINEMYRVMVNSQQEWLTQIPEVKRRSKIIKKCYKIVHLFPKIHEKRGHAPTRRIAALITSYDKKSFEAEIWLTASLIPSKETLSLWGLETATIKSFCSRSTLYQEACHLADCLEKEDVDVVVIHEPIAIHLILQRLMKVPLILMMEHGYYSFYPPLDGIIVSSEEQEKKIKEWFCARDIHVIANPKILLEPPRTCLKKSLYEKFLICTTITNRVEASLSFKMCQAICSVLQKIPNALYWIVGPYQNSFLRYYLFVEAGVAHRVRFRGYQEDIHKILDHTDIYLNSFPMGGECSVLEAMSHGLPVVTMYCSHFDQSAQAAAEHTLHAHTDSESYIHDILELSSSSDYRFLRGQAMKNLIDKRGHYRDYQIRHEKIISFMMENI